MQFGRKSEKLDPGQFALALEDVEQVVAASEAADDKQNKAAAAARAEKRRANRWRAAGPSSARSRHDRARGPDLPVLPLADAYDRGRRLGASGRDSWRSSGCW